MQERHIDRETYFQEQGAVTKKYIIPTIDSVIKVTSELTVAEIGCGEAGNLKPFLDMGCKTIGIDIAANKIDNAKKFYANHPHRNNLTLLAKDINHVNADEIEKVDLVIMRDTLEHIPNQAGLLLHITKFLKPGGKIFLGFPPWRMPFGGHQQICVSRLSKIPYIHLLPTFLYARLLKLFGETQSKINSLLEIKQTGISISRFKAMVAKTHCKIEKEVFYLINPNYEIKFNLKPRELPQAINIPHISDFMTTTCYYVIGKQ